MVTGGGSAVAKKRKQAPKGEETPLPKVEPTPPSVIVSVRVSADFRAWLDDLVEHERMGLSDVFDRAIVDYARKVGFPKAAPKR
jgi:hypothetical protein